MDSGRIARRLRPDFMAFYETAGDGASWSNPVVDLSVGGVFLRTSKPLAPGTTVDLLLADRSRPLWVRARARVVWSGRKDQHRGMGVRFEHTPRSQASMCELVARLNEADQPR